MIVKNNVIVILIIESVKREELWSVELPDRADCLIENSVWTEFLTSNIQVIFWDLELTRSHDLRNI